MDEPNLIQIEPSQGRSEALILINGYLTEKDDEPEDYGQWCWTIRKAGWKGSIYHLWWDSSKPSHLINPADWNKHKNRAKKTGSNYLNSLVSQISENSVSLMGYSLGARVAYYGMINWYQSSVLLNNVILFAGAITRGSKKDWGLAASRLNGNLINVYNSDDKVLKHWFKIAEVPTNPFLSSPCGLKAIKDNHSKIINVNATSLMDTSSHSLKHYLRVLDQTVAQRFW